MPCVLGEERTGGVVGGMTQLESKWRPQAAGSLLAPKELLSVYKAAKMVRHWSLWALNANTQTKGQDTKVGTPRSGHGEGRPQRSLGFPFVPLKKPEQGSSSSSGEMQSACPKTQGWK